MPGQGGNDPASQGGRSEGYCEERVRAVKLWTEVVEVLDVVVEADVDVLELF